MGNKQSPCLKKLCKNNAIRGSDYCEDHTCGYKSKRIPPSLTKKKLIYDKIGGLLYEQPNFYWWDWKIWENMDWDYTNINSNEPYERDHVKYKKYKVMHEYYVKKLKKTRCRTCTNLKKGENYYCSKHAHKCRVLYCNRKSKSYSNYCNIHTCTIEDCAEKTTIEDNLSLFKNHPYCKNHVCGLNKCNRERTRGRYCSKHQCKVKKCKRHKTSKKSKYCIDHKCGSPGCKNKRTSDLKYCERHTCKVKRCDTIKKGNEMYCEYHLNRFKFTYSYSECSSECSDTCSSICNLESDSKCNNDSSNNSGSSNGSDTQECNYQIFD